MYQKVDLNTDTETQPSYCTNIVTFMINNNNNQFLYSAFHNNRINALYISALVIGPMTSLFNASQLPWEYTTWATVNIAPKAFSFTISSSTLAGTHLYPWVKRRVYD